MKDKELEKIKGYNILKSVFSKCFVLIMDSIIAWCVVAGISFVMVTIVFVM